HLLDDQVESTPSGVEAPGRRQAGEEWQVILTHKRKSFVFTSCEECVSDQSYGNHLAIRKEWLWTALTPLPVCILQYLICIVHQNEPHGEYVLPTVLCDKIS